MTVDQYVSKFYQLARHAPRLVTTGSNKARRFLKGLKYEIRSHIISVRRHTLKEAIDSALAVEHDLRIC